MPKKSLIILIIIGLAAIGGISIRYFSQKTSATPANTQCQVKEMIFYYLDQCSYCQKVKEEGTIDKIKDLGVEVKEINAAVGPIRHKFRGVPTFVIQDKVYSGYKTFEELNDLLGCSGEVKQPTQNLNQILGLPEPLLEEPFFGEKGENLALENEVLKIDASLFSDNKTRFYNVKMPSNKIVYFFVVKDKKGVYRAAANACQVCFGERKGFHQEGNEIVCDNCGNRYPMEKIATEKGGCNPGPINPNLAVKDGKIIIKQSDIEQVAELF